MGTPAKVMEDRIVMKKRKIQKAGNSYYVSIPPEFIKRLGLKKGEEVVVIAKGNTLQVIAMQE